MAKGEIPKIEWGTGFASTLVFGYALDSARSFSRARQGSERIVSASGIVDRWNLGLDYFLRAIARWIPITDTADPVATGWDGATGVDAFLQWAADGHLFRFYPDKGVGTFLECYLDEPIDEEPGLEGDGTRQVQLLLRTGGASAGIAFTGY